MTTTSVGATQVGEPARSHAMVTGPILVASDGTDGSRPAIEAARELWTRHRSRIRVLAVVPELPALAWKYSLPYASADETASRREELLLRVKAQVLDVAGVDAEWPIDIRVGDPAAEIAQGAAETHVQLIALGVEHRHLSDRVLAREVAIRVMQLVHLPMLMTPGGFATAPTRMMLATDFSPANIRAARQALALYPSLNSVNVVHVAPREQTGMSIVDWMTPDEEAIEQGFHRVAAELSAVRRLVVTPVLLRGTPARQVIKLAQSTPTDLLVTSTAARKLVERFLVGSQARGIMRGAPCAVLVVPSRLGSENA